MRTSILFSLLGAVLATPAAHADCEWNESQARTLARIQNSLESQRRSTTAWRVSWGMGYGALALGQYSLATASDSTLSDLNQTPEALVVNGTKSALAATTIAAIPLLVSNERFPATCEGLAQARAALEDAGRRQAKGRRWPKHAIVIGVNVAAGLILGLGYDQWREGLISTVSGIAFGEATIWTQPTGAIDAAAKYGDQVTWRVSPLVNRQSYGMVLSVTY